MEVPLEEFRFSGVVERFAMKGGWHYVALPFESRETFQTGGPVWIEASIAGHVFSKALMPIGDGRHMLPLNTELRKAARLRVGDTVEVIFRLLTAPPTLQIPTELAALLDFLPDFGEAWEELPLSLRRGVLHWLSTGRTSATREKRAAEILRRYEERISWFAPG